MGNQDRVWLRGGLKGAGLQRWGDLVALGD